MQVLAALLRVQQEEPVKFMKFVRSSQIQFQFSLRLHALPIGTWLRSISEHLCTLVNLNQRQDHGRSFSGQQTYIVTPEEANACDIPHLYQWQQTRMDASH